MTHLATQTKHSPMDYLSTETTIQPNAAKAKRAKPKPWRIDSVIDQRKLDTQLEAAALDNIGNPKVIRARALELLHGALFRGRLIAQDRLMDGADGLDTARLMSAVQNNMLESLYKFTTKFAFAEGNRTDGEKLAVFAVGGFGRNVLAPSSDIDLLFLRNYKQTPWAESVIEYMLYMLWDMGLKVGHAFRTVDECMRLAKEDLNTQTALLDARFLFGDETIATSLEERYQTEVVRGKRAKFIADKLGERDRRHLKQGDSRYLVEPNIKEGKGGLRDLQTLFWLVKYVYGGITLEDVTANTNVFTPEEAKIFRKAARFLWTVRCHIHFLTGRPEERLSFDLQPEIAKLLGYEDKGARLGVERFMKRYFLEAKAVGSLTRILCARLEADQRKTKSGLFDFLPKLGEQEFKAKGFALDAGRLSITDESLFQSNPVEMLKLFVLAMRYNLDIHPLALSAVTRALNKFKAEHRESPEAISLFLELLVVTKRPGPVLRVMNEAGLLGRMVPEFGAIVAQTQFNMYHHYTVDEHTLRAVEVIAELEADADESLFPFAGHVLNEISDKRILYLAMLLHDTGKGLGDQQIEGAKTAKKACLRLGLNESDADEVAWLVRNHLEMSDCAQRRDISDPRTVVKFAERVETLDRLKALLVLTVADINAVGPGIWNGWKGQLLKDLYSATADALSEKTVEEGQVASQIDRNADKARDDTIADRGSLPKILDDMGADYWSSFDTYDLLWHHDVLSGSDALPVIAVRSRDDLEAVECLICAPDRIGLFADLTHAIASEGATIAAAQIFTTKAGLAFDTFILQDEAGHLFAYGDKRRLEQLVATLRSAASESGFEPKTRSKRTVSQREAVFVVEPDVTFDNKGSAEHTIVELTGKERIGLLHDLAKVFATARIQVFSAHAQDFGERIQDTFYVQTEDGRKLTDSEQIEALASALLNVLQSGPGDAPRTPARQLAQARSSESF